MSLCDDPKLFSRMVRNVCEPSLFLMELIAPSSLGFITFLKFLDFVPLALVTLCVFVVSFFHLGKKNFLLFLSLICCVRAFRSSSLEGARLSLRQLSVCLFSFLDVLLQFYYVLAQFCLLFVDVTMPLRMASKTQSVTSEIKATGDLSLPYLFHVSSALIKLASSDSFKTLREGFNKKHIKSYGISIQILPPTPLRWKKNIFFHNFDICFF